MSNCTGIIYGNVTWAADGTPVPQATMNLNWIVRTDGPYLSIGGSDDLRAFVPYATSTSTGNYVIPFYWASTQAPGGIVSVYSAIGIQDPSTGQSSNSAVNLHANPQMGLDVRRLVGLVAPPAPDSPTSVASTFLNFYLADPELVALGALRRMFPNVFAMSTELQGLYCRADFQMPSTPGIYGP